MKKVGLNNVMEEEKGHPNGAYELTEINEEFSNANDLSQTPQICPVVDTTVDSLCRVENGSQNRPKSLRRLLSISRKKLILGTFLFATYLTYFLYATLRCVVTSSCQRDENWWKLVVSSLFGFSIAFLSLLHKTIWPLIRKQFIRKFQCLPSSQFTKWIVFGTIIGVYLTFVTVDAIFVRSEPYSLISLAGVAVILLACTIVSRSHRHINLRPVVVGITLQFIFGLIVLRWPFGQQMMSILGNEVDKFIKHADVGAQFIWPKVWQSRDFAFAVLPIIPFFAAFTSVLYYLGWAQAVIKVLANVMEKLMGTTAGESTTCSANVFLGMTEAPLLVRPFLPYMTQSELHAVMTGGFATIAGSIIGAFIGLGVEPRHLLAASLMSAPASLALSKLVFPEIEQTAMSSKQVKAISKSNQETKPGNVIEAACQGATMSIPVVASIAVNIIAIISMLSLIDAILTWFGERVGFGPPGFEPLTLEFLVSYLFWPIVYVMGIPFQDCRSVAKLIGLKMFANEFVAFKEMGTLLANHEKYDLYYCEFVDKYGDYDLTPTLFQNGSYFLPAVNATIGPFISRRSEAVATYALCGFSNVAAMGIQIGAIGSMVPEKKPLLAAMVVRAMFAGTAVNLLNAATAGLLLNYSEPSWSSVCSFLSQNQ